MTRYMLNALGEPEPCPDLLTWGRWYETADRRVGNDVIGDTEVSTVFLGLDHNFGADKPILYETMVFGGELDGEQVRYATKAEALVGHAAMVDRVKKTSGDCR